MRTSIKVSVVVLAGGKGKRMVSRHPKMLHKICGKDMIYYIIKEAKKISDDITVIVGHQKKLVRDAISNYFDNIKFVTQDLNNYPGTAGGLRNLKLKYKNTVILCSDMPLIKADTIKKVCENLDADVTLGVIKSSNPKGYGRVIFSNQKVQQIVEENNLNRAQSSINTINSGIYSIKSDVLNSLVPMIKPDRNSGELYLTDIISLAKSTNKKVDYVYLDEECCIGINSKLNLAKADEIMQNRIKNTLMEKGVTIKLKDSVYIEYGVDIDSDSVIDPGVYISSDSTIKDTHIKANCVIENSYIKNSSIGPMARVREKSYIVDCKIGNFVEVKNSKINQIKASHLSYIGDASISEGTNVGAGVIICNYDGKRKHKSFIGKNVFIGSNVQIIAPINIEDDVIIAAGSVVNKNIQKGYLAISRAPLKLIKGYFYKFFTKK